jgi:hypothetical protein
MHLSDEDYYELTHLMRKLLIRVRDGECSADEGTRELMHVLNAVSNGGAETRDLSNTQSSPTRPAPKPIEHLPPQSITSHRMGLGELAVRTAVRATVWELVWSFFRRR